MSHHGVCADWNRRAGHDADCMTGLHGNWRVADTRFAVGAGRNRQASSRGHSVQVRNAHREAVHRTHIKRRARAVGVHCLREHSPR